ncbi:hypothetical protein FPV67DRAFT_1521081 [Lyophyllum atratum]|nr:hypothetical protein FPV67DRAFT_1521081 [Lyophyllum atratum]
MSALRSRLSISVKLYALHRHLIHLLRHLAPFLMALCQVVAVHYHHGHSLFHFEVLPLLNPGLDCWRCDVATSG